MKKLIPAVLTAMHQQKLSAEFVEAELQRQCKNPHLMELEQLEQMIRNIVNKTVHGKFWSASTAVDDMEGFV